MRFIISTPILNPDNFDMGVYKKLENPLYVDGYITFDEFGNFYIENYLCVANFLDEALTSFEFTGKYGSNVIKGTGKVLERGLLFIEYSGSDTNCDYYTTSESTIKGVSNGANLIYQVEINDSIKYLFAYKSSRNPDDYIGYVDVVIEDELIPFGSPNCLFKVISEKGDEIIRGRWISNGGNAYTTYELSDEYYGTYTNDGLEDLVLDGFGNFIRGEESGTYVVTLTDDGCKIDLSSESGTSLYYIDIDEKIYGSVTFDPLKDVRFDCGNIGTYYGETVSCYFVFDGAGGVTYYLNCNDEDYYSFWAYKGKTGIKGTYTIEGTSVHLVFPGDSYVSSHEFDFTLDDEVSPTTMTCTACNFASYYCGYIKPGKVFIKK